MIIRSDEEVSEFFGITTEDKFILFYTFIDRIKMQTNNVVQSNCNIYEVIGVLENLKHQVLQEEQISE
jgi:hypothetical protein